MGPNARRPAAAENARTQTGWSAKITMTSQDVTKNGYDANLCLLDHERGGGGEIDEQDGENEEGGPKHERPYWFLL